MSPERTSAFSIVEVALPLPITHAWMAYACRAAHFAAPRWSESERVWTTRSVAPDRDERLTISAGEDQRSVRVLAEWRVGAGDSSSESHHVRRFVNVLVTGMEWAIGRAG